MAKQTFQDAEIFFHTERVTPYSNQVSMDIGAEDQDATTFSENTRISKTGLRTASGSLSGFWDARSVDGGPDANLFDQINNRNNQPFLVVPNGTASVGNVAYFMDAILSSYQPVGAAVGEIMPISLEFSSHGPIVRGVNLKDGTENSSGSGSTASHKSVDSGETLVGVLYVLSGAGSGDTLDVTIESDDGGGNKTTQITFDQVTDNNQSAQIVESTSTTTDSLYNAAWTISSASGDWEFVVAVGVVPAA